MTPSVDPFGALAASMGHGTPEDAVADLCGRARRAAGEAKPPVALGGRLCEMLGAEVVPGRLEGGGGRLHCEHGRYRITVDAAASWPRKRWIAAHELGHALILDRLADQPEAAAALSEPKHIQRLEALCNLAAGELLVPSRDLLKQLDGGTWSPDGLARLSSRYLVSWPALARRISQAVPSSTVVLWERGARTRDTSSTFRVRGCYGRRFVPEGLSNRYLSQDLLAAAAAAAVAGCSNLTIGFSGTTFTSRALVTRLPGRHELAARHVTPSRFAAMILLDAESEWHSATCGAAQLSLAV